MGTRETTAPMGRHWGSVWFDGAIGISVFTLFTTLLRPLNNSLLRYFDIGVESNLAALWSGILLLLIALHAFDGWAAHRATAPAIARAWLIIALVMGALSLDEVGSFHERVPTFGGHSEWLTLLPFGIIFGSMVAYALFILFRSPLYRASARLIAFGFLLFGTVAIQEYIQNSYDFTGNVFGIDVFRIRTVVEEGTELLGMFFILKAAMGNTKGMLGKPPRAPFPVFEAICDLRMVILVGGSIGAIVLAYLSLYLGGHTNFSQAGQPTAWLASALFFLTALNALRPVLIEGRGAGWQGWTMAGLALIACGSTTLSAQSPATLPLMVSLSAVACVLWYLDPRHSTRTYVPAMAFLAGVFFVTWLLRESDFFAYSMVQFVALGFFYVGSARGAAEALPAALLRHAPGE